MRVDGTNSLKWFEFKTDIMAMRQIRCDLSPEAIAFWRVQSAMELCQHIFTRHPDQAQRQITSDFPALIVRVHGDETVVQLPIPSQIDLVHAYYSIRRDGQ